jgi:hypothetical protein
MTYETYWSILDTPAKSIRSYDVFLYIIAISLIAWLLVKKFKKSDGNIEKLILLWFTGILFICSGSGFIYLKIYDKDESYQNTKKLLESSAVGRVEGNISDFRSVLVNARHMVTRESFTVDSIDFTYSDELLGRFDRFSKTNSGVLRDGLPVRITYGRIHHEILKIEIANDEIPLHGVLPPSN